MGEFRGEFRGAGEYEFLIDTLGARWWREWSAKCHLTAGTLVVFKVVLKTFERFEGFASERAKGA